MNKIYYYIYFNLFIKGNTLIRFNPCGTLGEIHKFYLIGEVIDFEYVEDKIYYLIKILKDSDGFDINYYPYTPKFTNIPSWYAVDLSKNILKCYL